MEYNVAISWQLLDLRSCYWVHVTTFHYAQRRPRNSHNYWLVPLYFAKIV